jgi:hypothetical protein
MLTPVFGRNGQIAVTGRRGKWLKSSLVALRSMTPIVPLVSIEHFWSLRAEFAASFVLLSIMR